MRSPRWSILRTSPSVDPQGAGLKGESPIRTEKPLKSSTDLFRSCPRKGCGRSHPHPVLAAGAAPVPCNTLLDSSRVRGPDDVSELVIEYSSELTCEIIWESAENSADGSYYSEMIQPEQKKFPKKRRLLADPHQCTDSSFATICRGIQARMRPTRDRSLGVLRDQPDEINNRS